MCQVITLSREKENITDTKLKIGEKDVLVMEGIHGLNGTLTNGNTRRCKI